MSQDEYMMQIPDSEIKDSLIQIKQYLENEIAGLKWDKITRETAIKKLKEELDHVEYVAEGNKQLINKLLGELSKLQNDVEWYKKTYEQRSFLGMIREKIFRKIEKA